MDKEQQWNLLNTLVALIFQLQDGFQEHLQIKILKNFKNPDF